MKKKVDVADGFSKEVKAADARLWVSSFAIASLQATAR